MSDAGERHSNKTHLAFGTAGIAQLYPLRGILHGQRTTHTMPSLRVVEVAIVTTGDLPFV